MDSIFHHRLDSYEEHALAEDPFDCPGLLRGRIRRGDQICSQEVGKRLRINGIALDARLSDSPHFRRVCENHLIGDFVQPVVHGAPVIGRFHHSLDGFVVIGEDATVLGLTCALRLVAIARPQRSAVSVQVQNLP